MKNEFYTKLKTTIVDSVLNEPEHEEMEEDVQGATLVNLTPHTVTINGVDYLSEGLARCSSSSEVVDHINGIEVRRVVMGNITGLPEPTENTFYIVSRVVAEAAKGEREDLVITDGAIRNESNQIIGCTGLARV